MYGYRFWFNEVEAKPRFVCLADKDLHLIESSVMGYKRVLAHLQQGGPIGNMKAKVRVVPLVNLVGIMYDPDEGGLYFRYVDETGDEVNVSYTMLGTGEEVLKAVLAAAPFEMTVHDEPLALSRVSFFPAVAGFMSIAVLALGIWTNMDSHAQATRVRRGAAFKALFEALGMGGTILIFGGITLGVFLWWLKLAIKRPTAPMYRRPASFAGPVAATTSAPASAFDENGNLM